MLIEFRVKNFRSFKDEQVFSLVAAKNNEYFDTNVFPSPIKTVPNLLRSAVVYGSNAAGKTNLIKALHYMRAVVIESTKLQPTDIFYVQPFRLDTEMEKDPTEFEITFIEEGVRYQYGFSMTKERIYDEWLLVYQTSQPQRWFARYYDPETSQYSYTHSKYLKGSLKTWQDATRSNALFLATAVNLNSEQLRPIYQWITQKLIVFTDAVPHDFSTRMMQDNRNKEFITSFLRSGDISLSDISLEKKKGFFTTFHVDINSGESNVMPANETDILIPKFHHETDYGSAIFEYEDESKGTQQLFNLAGPIMDILDSGRILVIDELNSHLHSLLVEQLVALFHHSEFNKMGAQLVFTTHDTTLLERELFRRDQIWLVNKQMDTQASKLYPLTDYSPRKGEALEKGYLAGRYGAVPFLSGWELPQRSHG